MINGEAILVLEPNLMFVFLDSKLQLPEAALKLAQAGNFELAGYKFDVQEEQLRKPRIIRIGAVQNKIVLPTSAPIANQVNKPNVRRLHCMY